MNTGASDITTAVATGSGQPGAAIVRALVEMNTGETVVSLALAPEKAPDLGIEIRLGDDNEPAQLRASLEGVVTVALVSGMAAPDVRIGQHRNVMNAAKAASATKIVYTPVQRADAGTSFSPIIWSNRQTERDVRESGLDCVIGRNGIYIEPDIEYFESHKKTGEIVNPAGEDCCGYTTRGKLAYAFAAC